MADEMGLIVETVDTVALPASPTVADIVRTVRQILSKPDIQEIRIRAQGIMVTWRHHDGDELDVDLVDPEANAAIQDVELIMGDGWELGPFGQLGRAAFEIDQRGLAVSHVIVGRDSVLYRWLGLPQTKPTTRLLGGSIVEDTSYPSDILFVLGAPSSMASLKNTVFGVKLSMDVKDAQ